EEEHRCHVALPFLLSYRNSRTPPRCHQPLSSPPLLLNHYCQPLISTGSDINRSPTQPTCTHASALAAAGHSFRTSAQQCRLCFLLLLHTRASTDCYCRPHLLPTAHSSTAASPLPATRDCGSCPQSTSAPICHLLLPTVLPLFPATTVYPQPQPPTAGCLLFPVAFTPSSVAPAPAVGQPSSQPLPLLLLVVVAATASSQPSSPLPSSSIAVGPHPLKHQQLRLYLAAPHLLGAPHDAATSSLAAAALTAAAASNRAPCRCTSLLPPLPLPTTTVSATATPPYCHHYPFLPPPPLATTAAPTSPTSFLTYW
ncbi:hypothetical protein BHE74_00050325, partial [Ensete ventricosum]